MRKILALLFLPIALCAQSNYIAVSWPKATNSNVNAYNLYLGKKDSNNVNFSKVFTIYGINKTNYNLYTTNLFYGHTNYIGISCFSTNNYNNFSNSINDVSLAWTPSADSNIVAGYKIYFGFTNIITNSFSAGNVLYTVVSNLWVGSNYFFFATAYDTNNVESEPSNVVFYRPESIPFIVLESDIKEVAKFYVPEPINNVKITVYLQSSTNFINWITDTNFGPYSITVNATNANKMFRGMIKIDNLPATPF